MASVNGLSWSLIQILHSIASTADALGGHQFPPYSVSSQCVDHWGHWQCMKTHSHHFIHSWSFTSGLHVRKGKLQMMTEHFPCFKVYMTLKCFDGSNTVITDYPTPLPRKCLYSIYLFSQISSWWNVIAAWIMVTVLGDASAFILQILLVMVRTVGWWVYKAQEFDTRQQGSCPQLCDWELYYKNINHASVVTSGYCPQNKWECQKMFCRHFQSSDLTDTFCYPFHGWKKKFHFELHFSQNRIAPAN